MILGGWDIVPESYSESCRIHGVVPKHVLSEISDRLDKTDIYHAIQWVKKTARGFRNVEHFKTAIYFHCGGLDFYPHEGQ